MGRKSTIYDKVDSKRHNRHKFGASKSKTKLESQKVFSAFILPFLSYLNKPNYSKKINLLNALCDLLPLEHILESKQISHSPKTISKIRKKLLESLITHFDKHNEEREILRELESKLYSSSANIGDQVNWQEREQEYLFKIEFSIETDLVDQHLLRFIKDPTKRNYLLFIEFYFYPFTYIHLYDFHRCSLIDRPIRLCPVCDVVFNANLADRNGNACSDRCQMYLRRKKR